METTEPTPTSEKSHTKAYVAGGICVLLMTVGTYLLLRGISSSAGRPLTTLDPRGEGASTIHDLVVPVFAVAGIVFILVEGAILLLLFRFRRHRDEVDGVEEPRQIHGSKLEWVWTVVPAIMLAVLAVPNVQTIWSMEDTQNNPDMSVGVIGQQWWWEFRYDTDSDGVVDIITASQMVIPVETNVRVNIQSNDVIHSFWIPALNGKRDAVPGHTQGWSISADKPGIYEGQCTEFCGLSHGYMRMQVKALSKPDYEKWVENQRTGAPTPPAGSPAEEGLKLMVSRCLACHQINNMDRTGGAKDPVPNPDYEAAQISGNAPNLTHLMSRERFAGNMFELFNSYDPGAGPETAMPSGQVDEGSLSRWLRDPALVKPLDPERERGMPNLKLTEDEIAQLVAYLSTLK